MPDQKRLLYTSSNDTNYSVAIPFGSPNPISSGVTSNKLNEDGNVIALDLSRQFKLLNIRPTVKVGFYNSTKNRTFNSRAFGWSTGKFNPDLDILPPNAIFNDSNISKDRYFLSEITGGQDKYTASSLLRAYYISFDHYLFKRFRLNYGVRYESFNQQLTAFNPQIGGEKTYNNTYENFFPMANITYNITEKTNLRFSYSQTTVRPEFREIAPFTFYDFINNSLTVGDTALKPINIKNYDLRFEYYPSGGQVFTLTYFYKTFSNAIENTFKYGSGNRLRTFENIKDVKCQGVELEFRVNPGIALSYPEKHWTRYLTLSCNSSLIESEADLSNLGASSGSDTKRQLQGQSGYSINGGLLIMPPSSKWSLNVLYNRIGRRIGDVGGRKELHIWEVPRDLIDAQVSYTFNKNVTLKLTASDLLNQYYMMYSDLDGNGTYNEVKDIVVNKAKFGTTFTFAIGITL
jgi:TonB-dependent receptor